jgi:hypothetical protein
MGRDDGIRVMGAKLGVGRRESWRIREVGRGRGPSFGMGKYACFRVNVYRSVSPLEVSATQ